MIDDRELLERAARQFTPDNGFVERVHSRHERKRRNRRVGTAAFVLALATAALILVGVRIGTRETSTPISQPSPNVLVKVHGWIAYGSLVGGHGITMVDPAHPEREVGIPSHADDQPIGWSRDGNRLLVVQRSSPVRLFVISADGSEIPASPPSVTAGSLSPDGNQVVYEGLKKHNLYLYDIRTGAHRLLVRRHKGDVSMAPAWSPDGSRIAFISARGLSVVNADGSGRRTISTLKSYWFTLAWSPDGSQIAFGAGGKENERIYVVGSSGGGLRAVSPPGGLLTNPAWSPDGSRIAFVSVDGSDYLQTVRADGSDRRILRTLPSGVEYLAWNPGH